MTDLTEQFLYGEGVPLVLVHGVWMTGLELGWLGQRLKQHGFDVHYFRYHSLALNPERNARALGDFLAEKGWSRVHLVGHSLGGIILLHLLNQGRSLPDGRILLLGSPVNGSRVARSMNQNPLLRPFLGQSIDRGLLGDLPAWPEDRPPGVIAGTSGVGIGRLFCDLQEPNDGTVEVAETRLPKMADYLELPVGHMGMLVSAEIAAACSRFLVQGHL